MDWPSILTSIISGLVLAAIVGGVAIAKSQAMKVCNEMRGLAAEALAAKEQAAATQRQTDERFSAINGRLDELQGDMREVRAVLLRRSEGER